MSSRGVLVRVGVDQSYGHWNAPVDPDSGEFVFVPIPEEEDCEPPLRTPYLGVEAALDHFAAALPAHERGRARLPEALRGRNTHLDPDFAFSTYGRRWTGLHDCAPGDAIVFFAGLRPTRPCPHRILYAIIGYFEVVEVLFAKDVPADRRHENAHTRRARPRPEDLILRANPSTSGRLRRCLPVGGWRDHAYRVRRDLLEQWGGLSSRDGYIQRSAVPPRVLHPDRFRAWFRAQGPELIHENNPGAPRPG